MSIAKKFEVIADEVHEKGRQDELSEFWDSHYIQNANINLQYLFAYPCWNDKSYKPITNIIVGRNGWCDGMFYNTSITDTKVDIDFTAFVYEAINVFRSSKLKTIKKVIVAERTLYSGWFVSAKYLENIAFEGVIGNDINFSSCTLLTVESMVGTVATEEQINNGVNLLTLNGTTYYGGILIVLKDLTGTGETRTLTLGSANLAKLTDAQKAIATEKGWTLV